MWTFHYLRCFFALSWSNVLNEFSIDEKKTWAIILFSFDLFQAINTQSYHISVFGFFFFWHLSSHWLWTFWRALVHQFLLLFHFDKWFSIDLRVFVVVIFQLWINICGILWYNGSGSKKLPYFRFNRHLDESKTKGRTQNQAFITAILVIFMFWIYVEKASYRKLLMLHHVSTAHLCRF